MNIHNGCNGDSSNLRLNVVHPNSGTWRMQLTEKIRQKARLFLSTIGGLSMQLTATWMRRLFVSLAFRGYVQFACSHPLSFQPLDTLVAPAAQLLMLFARYFYSRRHRATIDFCQLHEDYRRLKTKWSRLPIIPRTAAFLRLLATSILMLPERIAISSVNQEIPIGIHQQNFLKCPLHPVSIFLH